MGLADRKDDVPGDFDALDFTWGVDCGRTTPSEWCFYHEPHEHGFACDRTCPCRTDQDRWRQDTNRENGCRCDGGAEGALYRVAPDCPVHGLATPDRENGSER